VGVAELTTAHALHKLGNWFIGYYKRTISDEKQSYLLRRKWS